MPVEYYYLEQLCIGDLRNFVESETIERVLCNIFINFMEDYGYRAEEMVPSIPLGYLLSLIGDFNQRIDEHMKIASIDAERKYIASMN